MKLKNCCPLKFLLRTCKEITQPILHLIFGPSLNAAQSQNPQRSPATPAVLLNRRIQTWPKSKRNIGRVISLPALTILLLQFFIFLPSTAASAPACAELVKSKCLSCHLETRICGKVKKRKGISSWKTTIKSMVRHGADLSKSEQKRLVACLKKPHIEVLELCGMKK